MTGLTIADPAFLAAASAAFSPLSLSPALWLDASDTSTITQSGGKVSQWNDLSGNTRNVVQATSANQPTTGATTQNSKNVLDFDGNDFLRTSTTQIVSASNGTYSIFSVVKPLNLTANNAGQIACLDTGVNPRRAQLLRFALATPQTVAHNTSNTAFVDNGPALGAAAFVYLSAVATTTTLEVWTNGSTNGSSSVSGTLSNLTGVLTVGANSAAVVGEYLRGSLAELIIYPVSLSATDRQSVQTYLANKWGL